MISLRYFFAALPLSFLFVLTASAATFESEIETGTLKAYTIESEHFQIEFSPLVKDQVDSDGDGVSDIVEAVTEALEDSWDFVVEDLGYSNPVDFSSGKILAIIDDNDDYLFEGAVGVAGVFSNGIPYLAVDAWAPAGVMRVTMVHEFYHVVQFGMDLEFSSYSQGVNLAESTAVWIEDLVYDDVNDYVNYINDFLDYPDYSIFASVLPEGSLYEYGLGLWPRFLHERFDQELMQEVWEEYAASSLSAAHHLKVYEAYEEALDERGEDLKAIYQEFMLWNLDLDQYEEGDLYPEVLALLDPVQGEFTSIDESYAPALFGSNYLYFENSNSYDELYFNLVKAEGVSYGVSLIPYDGSNIDMADAETFFIGKNEEWDGVVLSDLASSQAVVAIVSPLESNFMGLSEEAAENIFDQAHLYYYMAEYAEDAFALSGVASGVELESVSGEKEGEASELEHSGDTRTVDELVLSVLSFDEDSVTFEWNRPNWTDLDSYQLWYGTNVEYSDQFIVIDQAFVRFETVEDLVEGQTYYFQLVALDDSGNELDEASNIIAVTPSAELFTDVGHLHEYHDALATLVDEGIFEGYSDGSFKPDDEINRAEFLKILIEGRNLIFDPEDYQNCFSDVSDQWYAHYVCYAFDQGWVMGYLDGTFKPGDTISKVEALKILFQVYEEDLVPEGTFVAGIQYKDVKPRAWYSVYVGHAQNLGILEEEWGALFEPSGLRSRGEMAEQLYRYLVTQNFIERYE